MDGNFSLHSASLVHSVVRSLCIVSTIAQSVVGRERERERIRYRSDTFIKCVFENFDKKMDNNIQSVKTMDKRNIKKRWMIVLECCLLVLHRMAMACTLFDCHAVVKYSRAREEWLQSKTMCCAVVCVEGKVRKHFAAIAVCTRIRYHTKFSILPTILRRCLLRYCTPYVHGYSNFPATNFTHSTNSWRWAHQTMMTMLRKAE